MSDTQDTEPAEASSPWQSASTASGRLPRGRRWLHRLSVLASILLIAGVIGMALALLRSHASPAAKSNILLAGTPITSRVEAGGLTFSMQMTPGPYFLGELLLADLSLSNGSHTTYWLGGPKEAGPCGAAVFVNLTGGSGSSYRLPVADEHSCPFISSTLAPGETITLHEFLPVSTSGEVTLESGANFLQTTTDPSGNKSVTRGNSPLDGLWPSMKIQVATAAPSDRKITLRREGTQARIDAPAAVLGRLYYLYTVACVAFQGGTVETGNFAWEPISTTTLREPNCGDYGSQIIQWSYAVSSPGYAIASGQAGA